VLPVNLSGPEKDVTIALLKSLVIVVLGIGGRDTFCASDLFFKDLFQLSDCKFCKNMLNYNVCYECWIMISAIGLCE